VIEECRAVCFDPGMRRLPLILLVVAAALALAPGASGAVTQGPRLGPIWIECTTSSIEGQTYSEDCAISVEDQPGARDPGAVPSPPTGAVTVDGVSACTLVPSGEVASTCHWATTVTWGSSFYVAIYYPGDETHWQTFASFNVLAPGNLLLQPEIPARAPLPSEFPMASPNNAVPLEEPVAEPRIVSRPQKVTQEHVASFRFAGGEHYECALDGGGFHPSGGSFSHRVSTGSHALRLREKRGGPAAVFRWRVLPER
jgi:hypothetical protein